MVGAYVTDLRNKASIEGVSLWSSRMDSIRDMIVCGVNNNTVRARLLSESEWNLETCIDICLAAENSSAHLKILTS